MTPITKIYWLHALTPLHIGVGQGVGFIDLPIMREKVTNWPMVPGSSVKGVLSDRYDASRDGKRENNDDLRAAFGVGGDDHSSSGSLVFTDARIVFFPVRSLFGTFAWVTSPMVLSRLKRDLEMTGPEMNKSDIPVPNERQVLIPEGIASALKGAAGKIYFEDLDFDTKECGITKDWCDKFTGWIFPDASDPWRKKFIERFAIVTDDTFNFLCEMATEVNTRIRIDPDMKVVKPGQLWTEESLPAESILAGIVWCDKVYVKGIEPNTLIENYCTESTNLQVGGKATIGKGQVRCLFTGGV